MKSGVLFIIALVVMLAALLGWKMLMNVEWNKLSPEQRIADVKSRRLSGLAAELDGAGLKPGNPVFLRVMKESSEMEVWLQPTMDGPFQLLKTHPIARWSGLLGPKQKEGDKQAPEGCYGITRRLMHPGSDYHLAMNIGYPNGLDRALGRTGSLIMIHGKDVSVGCFAMTDPVIEEIYLLVDAALDAGQTEVPVHCFPFRMTDKRIAEVVDSPWRGFWLELKAVWDAFEKTKRVPQVGMVHGRYVPSP